MHQQIRSVPAKSPTDLVEFLRVLKEADVNLIAAGGNIANGGEFAFAVEDGRYEAAMNALADYAPRLVDVDHQLLPDVPGALHGFVTSVAARNRHRGWEIKDVSIGSPHGGKILVQVYSDVP